MKHSTELLADERRQRIVELLAREGKVKAQQLARLLQVSEDTIRRDLKDMAEQGLLRRVHGGAMPVAATAAGAPWHERVGVDADEKAALANAARNALGGARVLFIDSGTTNALLARHLPRDIPLTVVTHSPEVALALCQHERCEVVMPAGRLHPRTASLVGPDVLRLVESVHADLCVLGVCAVSAAAGFTCAEFEEQAIKQAMVRHARTTLALVTASKVGTVLPYRVAGLDDVAQLFTTAAEDDPALVAMAGLGLRASCVPPS
jgi:DeoR/GlpR family transcriptional regulator of sugar metabolism